MENIEEFSSENVEEQEEDSLLYQISDSNLISNILTCLFDSYNVEVIDLFYFEQLDSLKQEFQTIFSQMNNFKLVCKVFDTISKTTLFELIIYQIKFQIPFNIYLKVSFLYKQAALYKYYEDDIDCMLIHGCKYGFYEIIDNLIEKGGANINKQVDTNQSSYINSLSMAVSKNNIKTVGELLKYETLQVNTTTPFITACKKGYIEIAKLFLKRDDLSLNLKDNFGFTALMLSILYHKDKITSLLLSQKNRININIYNRNQKTALDLAKETKNFNVVYMLENFKKKNQNTEPNTFNNFFSNLFDTKKKN